MEALDEDYYQTMEEKGAFPEDGDWHLSASSDTFPEGYDPTQDDSLHSYQTRAPYGIDEEALARMASQDPDGLETWLDVNMGEGIMDPWHKAIDEALRQAGASRA